MYEETKLKKAYDASLKTMLELHSLLNKIQPEDIEKNIPGKPGAEASYEDGILTITIPELPPHKVRDMRNRNYINNETEKRLSSHYASMIVYAIAKLGKEIKFNKAMVSIKIYHNLEAPWDVDNRAYKFFIDGLRSAIIVEDDSYKYLSYMVSGCTEKDKLPKTEIVVAEYEKVAQALCDAGFEKLAMNNESQD